MSQTVFGMLENLLTMIAQHGSVPNGGRVYYLDRSQPPLLAQMVWDYYQYQSGGGARSKNDALQFACGALPLLDLEYRYWIQKHTSPEHGLAHYMAHTDQPRPEGYANDVETAENSPNQPYLYKQFATAAETGWDFSSRWFAADTLSTLQTSDVVPVDLNSILFANEVTLGQLHEQCGTGDSSFYTAAAARRASQMHELLWNDEQGMWFDFIATNGTQNKNFYPSNFLPLWAGAYKGYVAAEIVVGTLQRLQLTQYPGGIPSSLVNAAQQWDFPNVWPPSEWFVVEGLRTSGSDAGLALAKELSDIWLHSNYAGWNSTGVMYEKYDCTTCGAPGGGGEYDVQAGFGWTNGVVLDMLLKFYV
eukprot:TRINITY_DN8841_c0_g1_i1.p1 TRINITY_DN8841_c0_g1~~TRINITY_DN8841_c0_g1_i1.p1  ORF type:complete len:361 (+),score=99.60 TRINITY_DN8841_c0_g1_i1:758-1840(+)